MIGVPFWIFISTIIGGSLISFGFKSISRKPQLIFSDEGLYIGFNIKKIIPWSCIENIVIKQKTVDLISMNFISITTKIKSEGSLISIDRDFLIENLEVSTLELEKQIKYYIGDRKAIGKVQSVSLA